MHFIDNILIKEMGFKTTTHDRCIYRKVIDDEVVYILQQINDCITQTKREETAKNIFNIIGTKIRFASKEKKRIIPFEYLGIVKDYNDVDIKQTSHYIGMSCKSYIKRLYKSHDWDTTISTLDIDVEVNQLQMQHPSESTIHPEIDKKVLFSKALYCPNQMIPMPLDCIEKMYSEMGYKEGTAEHKVLEEKAGFAYCTLLGEIMYVYMTCQLDIGYTVTTLLKFSCPSSMYHYKLLKCLAQYLFATTDWESRFKKNKPLQLLDANYERGFFHNTKYEVPNEPEMEELLKADITTNKLVGFCDAAHANDSRNRCSTTAVVFTFMGGAIIYKSKTQSLTADSSMEAEFIAAHSTGKVAYYLQFLLKDLGYEQLVMNNLGLYLYIYQ